MRTNDRVKPLAGSAARLALALALTLGLAVSLAPTKIANALSACASSGCIIRNVYSYTCMDVRNKSTADGAKIQIWGCYAGTSSLYNNQRFILTPIASGSSYYYIKAKHSGKCLDVPNSSTADYILLQQWTCLGSTHYNQQWYLQSTSNGYLIKARHSGKCAQIFTTTDGADVYQKTCYSSSPPEAPWQRWLITYPS
jgi:hypothetical protein